jgi:EamA domain-containing membrane protein RarD
VGNVKRRSIICCGSTALVFLLVALWGVFALNPGDALGYSLLNFYLIMPVTSLVAGAFMGALKTRLKWIYPVVFGALGVLVPCAVFGSLWSVISLFFAFIPALAGVLVGSVILKIRGKFGG